MDYFVLEAQKEALKSPMSNKYGAILVHDNKIISRGFNFYNNNYYKHIGNNKECPLRD